MFTVFGYTELVRLRCKQGLNPFAMGLRRAAAALAPRGAPSCPPPAHTDTSVPVPAGTTPPQCGPKTAGGGTLRGAAAGEDSVTSATLSAGMLSTGQGWKLGPKPAQLVGVVGSRTARSDTEHPPNKGPGQRGQRMGYPGDRAAEGRKRGQGPGHPGPSQPSPSLQGRARGHRDPAPVTVGITAPRDPGGHGGSSGDAASPPRVP